MENLEETNKYMTNDLNDMMKYIAQLESCVYKIESIEDEQSNEIDDETDVDEVDEDTDETDVDEVDEDTDETDVDVDEPSNEIEVQSNENMFSNHKKKANQ